VIFSFPRVSVPVLSKAIARTLPSASRWCAPFTRIPSRVARVSAAMVTTGAARTIAQGHAMTSRTSARYAQVESPRIPAGEGHHEDGADSTVGV
jgi:hypothetical protein